MTTSQEIFISYSRKDIDIVEKIVEKLSKRGFMCWMDKNGIESGDAFKSVIVKAINRSGVFLFFSSESANNSQYAVKEVNVAVQLEKKIIPVKLDTSKYNDAILFDISGLDFVDFSSEANQEDAMNRLICSLTNKLSRGALSGGTSPIESCDQSMKSSQSFQKTKSSLGQGFSEDLLQKKNVLNMDLDIDFEEGIAFLEANQDGDAFLAFLRSAKKGSEKAKENLIEIAKKNSQNAQFLDDDTWEQIEELSDLGEGYADLLLHFKYYSRGTQNEVAFEDLLQSIKKIRNR